MTSMLTRLRYAAVACVAMLASACTAEVVEPTDTIAEPLSATNAADRAALALRWAPVHYQDVDQTGSHALGGTADYITRIDFDGDWNARNNWDNAGKAGFPLAAH